jgi:hypothetical protein
VPSTWVDWHRQYAQGRGLPERLRIVRRFIREAISTSPPGPVQVLSLCAGDGRDLIGALARHPRAHEVRARLIELEPELIRAGTEAAARRRLAQLNFVRADASRARSAKGAVPANVLLACGSFGNIAATEVRSMIEHFPELCAASATVIWTRGRTPPDPTPRIREWFREAGFREVEFVPVPRSRASVGSHRLEAPPRPYRPGVRLFTHFSPPRLARGRSSRPAGRRGLSLSRRRASPPRKLVRTKGG